MLTRIWIGNEIMACYSVIYATALFLMLNSFISQWTPLNSVDDANEVQDEEFSKWRKRIKVTEEYNADTGNTDFLKKYTTEVHILCVFSTMSSFNAKALFFRPDDDRASEYSSILIALDVVHLYVQMNILYSFYWPAHRQNNVRLLYSCCGVPAMAYVSILIWFLVSEPDLSFPFNANVRVAIISQYLLLVSSLYFSKLVAYILLLNYGIYQKQK